MFNQSEHTLWVEKYRPTTLDEYVGNDHLKHRVRQYIESNDIPHLLLFGKAGGGKSTLAKMIVNSINCDYLFINASDENGVDTIREKIKSFASSIGFKPIKVIILDEADFISAAGQAALRNVMETFSKNCRFILTCNYVEKIIDPVQSRCQTFQIIPPTKKEVAIQISKILKAENVTFQPRDLVPIIDSAYPDIRKIINTCQLETIGGQLAPDTQKLIENDYKLKVLEELKSNSDKKTKFKNLRQLIVDSRATDFTDLYSLLYEKIDDYANGQVANIILILGDSTYKSQFVIDKQINIMATLIQILNLI
jgi:DNA polymerase III delta prime subunit